MIEKQNQNIVSKVVIKSWKDYPIGWKFNKRNFNFLTFVKDEIDAFCNIKTSNKQLNGLLYVPLHLQIFTRLVYQFNCNTSSLMPDIKDELIENELYRLYYTRSNLR